MQKIWVTVIGKCVIVVGKRDNERTHMPNAIRVKGRGARRYQLLKASVKAGEQIFKKIIQFFLLLHQSFIGTHVDH